MVLHRNVNSDWTKAHFSGDDDDSAGPSDDQETILLVHDGSFKDHGSFEKKIKNGIAPDDKCKKSSGPMLKSSKESKDCQPMSIWRKIAFAMSFNVWAMYFVVFMWLIPCRMDGCAGRVKDWTFQLENAELIAYLGKEYAESELVVDDVVLLSHSKSANNVRGGNVTALDGASGNLLWSVPLDNFAKTLYRIYEKNSVLAISSDDIVMLNLTDGNTLWSREFNSAKIVPTIKPVLVKCQDDIRLIYVRRDSLNPDDWIIGALDIESGLRRSSFVFSCGTSADDSSLELLQTHNKTGVVILCHRRLTEDVLVVPVQMKDVCLQHQEDFIEVFVKPKFPQMLILKSVTQTDYLMSRVSLSSHVIILGWRKEIVLLSIMSDGRIYEKWRKKFNLTSNIESYFIGHYSSKNQQELAVVIEEEDRIMTMVEVLTLDNGAVIASAPVATTSSSPTTNSQVQAVMSVPRSLTSGAGVEGDSIILGLTERKSTFRNGLSSELEVSYLSIRFDKSPSAIEQLFTMKHARGDFKIIKHRSGLIFVETNGNGTSLNLKGKTFTSDWTKWCGR